MKNLLRLLLLLIAFNSTQCTSDLRDQLEGEWMSMDDIDNTYCIFFHKSGHYIVLNEFGDENLNLIAEKGTWVLIGKELILQNREFVAKLSDFSNQYGKDPLLTFKFDFKQKNKELELNQKRNKYIKTYRRIYTFPRITEIYNGFGPKVKNLLLPSSGARKLLKLSYKFFHYTTKECPTEVIIEDQKGNVLLHKKLIFTDEIKKEELLLAEKPEVFDLKELIFKINPQENGHWEIKAKLY